MRTAKKELYKTEQKWEFEQEKQTSEVIRRSEKKENSPRDTTQPHKNKEIANVLTQCQR